MAVLVKSLNGLAYGSVKSRNGLAVASIKSINGLDTTAGGGNWWEAGGTTGCVRAYKPKGAASYAASKSNLVSPGTGDATEPTANVPTWNTSTGWSFDGAFATNQVLSTGVALGNGSVTMILQFTGAVSAPFSIFTGYIIGGGYFYFGAFGGSGDGFSNGPNPEDVSCSVGRPAGNFAIAGLDGYLNGSVVGTDAGPIAANLNSPVFIGDAGSLGSPAGRGAAFTCVAYAIYSGILNATQVAAVASAMAAL